MGIGKQILAAVLAGGWMVSAQAATLSFGCITENDASGASCGIAAGQLSVEVTETADGNALFTFTNIGDGKATVGHIYFDADTLLGEVAGLSYGDYGKVGFEEGARRPNLPGGRQRDVNFIADYSLGAQNPGPFMGINNGSDEAYESLMVEFGLGGAYVDLLAALEDGSVRIGVHMKSFMGGYSESLVNTPYDGYMGPGDVPAVPVPGALLLFGSGLVGLAGAVVRRRAR